MAEDVYVSHQNTLSRVLPCLPGYAMGSIVPDCELEIPYIEQEIERLSVRYQSLEKRCISEINMKGKDSQALLSDARYEQNLVQRRMKVIVKDLKEMQQEKEKYRFAKAMLPIDYRASSLCYRSLSQESENLHYILLKGSDVKNELDLFAKHLSKSGYLPEVTALIDQISERILKMIADKQEVCIVGSFVTLNRIRALDPVVLRQDAVLDPEIVNHHHKYSVISEVVLGGVFIGFGTYISAREEKKAEEKNILAIASKVNVFSFVSQGVIPPTDTLNLWDTYNKWKMRLISDTHCGFPIAFKVRSLSDILKENRLL